MNLLNNISIIKGNIGNIKRLESKDSEDTGVELSVATEDNAYYKENGDRVSQQSWHKVVSWGAVGDAIHENAAVGDTIQLVGQFLYQKWEDEHEQNRKTAYLKPRSFDVIRKKASSS